MGTGQSTHVKFAEHHQTVAPQTHWTGAGLETVSTCLTVLPDAPSLEPLDVTHFYYEQLSHYSEMGWDLASVSGESGIQVIPVFEKPSSQPIEVRMWFQRNAPTDEGKEQERGRRSPVEVATEGVDGKKYFPYKVVRCAFRSHADAGMFNSSQITQLDLVLPTLSDHAKLGWRLSAIFCVGSVCQHTHKMFTEVESQGFVDIFLHRPSATTNRRFVYATSPLTYNTHMGIAGVGRTRLQSSDLTGAMTRLGQAGWRAVAVIPMSMNTNHGLFRADVMQYLLAICEQPAHQDAIVQETLAVQAPDIEFALPTGLHNLGVAMRGRDDFDRAMHKGGDLRSLIARWGENGWRFVAAIPQEGIENYKSLTLKTKLIFQRDQMKATVLNQPELVTELSPTLVLPMGSSLLGNESIRMGQLRLEAAVEHRHKVEEEKARKDRLIHKKEVELRKLELEAEDTQRRIERAEREQPTCVQATVVRSPLTPLSPHSGVSSSSESGSDVEADDVERRRQRIRHQAKAARKWRKDQGDSKHPAPIESSIVDERRLRGPLVLE